VVAAVAVLEGVTDGRWRWGDRNGRQGRQLGCEAVGQEGGRAAQGFWWQVAGQGVAYGGGGEVPFQPGDDARGEVFGVVVERSRRGSVRRRPARTSVAV
jgi:hypothetical protein